MNPSIEIPDFSLVVLIGASGAGKSTFAARHFRPTEVLGSDQCRALVADDPDDQAATLDAFAVLHAITARRLAACRLTVVDATNVQAESRRPLVALAKAHHALAVAVVLDLPPAVCLARNAARTDRHLRPDVVRQQVRGLRGSLRHLGREGFRYVRVLRTPEEVEAATVVRRPLWVDRRDAHGPFDLIGDIHGCRQELEGLLTTLGYVADPGGAWRHPGTRTAVFLGDLVDRGPDTPGVLRIVMGMVAAGQALAVAGNHDVKLARALAGRDVRITHGLAESLDQLGREPAEFRAAAGTFLDGLVSHYVLDGGRLVAAHAGLRADLQGRASARVREFALYGDTTGETDEFGLPVRYPWATEYRGRATVVYGHTPVPSPEWLNSTINVDTGCVFGGRLTALRWPERELVQVPAVRVWYAPARPFAPDDTPAASDATLTAQQTHDTLLDLADVAGKRVVAPRWGRPVRIDEGHAAAVIETLSRFGVDPRWLVYLPPTMAPAATAPAGTAVLERPAEVFAEFRTAGVADVMCEEKHMGSRAVCCVTRDDATAARRFGVREGGAGVVYTRTGRPFFADAALAEAVLRRLRAACEVAGLWRELDADWVCLDAELLPWSAKAQELLRRQYAATGAAGTAALADAVVALARDADASPEGAALLARYRSRATAVARYREAYRRYCWPVTGIADLRLAPFHVLASGSTLHVDRDHTWHLAWGERLAAADPAFCVGTRAIRVACTDPASEAAATTWWEQLTAAGGEGTVVKPMGFLTRGPRGLVQPGVKCRGPEYLRIIYGPEYGAPEHLERLRARGLARKRALALREFTLGLEALARFVAGEPLRRVHECVAAVLALESEPVDPRL